MRKLLLVVALSLPLSGCTDAQWAKNTSLGGRHKVTVYSGGVAVKTYISTGAVKNEQDSDGYYFMDSATNKLVTVSGTLTVELE